jgi:hypothetical protein
MADRIVKYRVLVGRPRGTRPLGRPRQRWEDNVKMDLQGLERGDMDRISLFQDRDRWRASVNAVTNWFSQTQQCNYGKGGQGYMFRPRFEAIFRPFVLEQLINCKCANESSGSIYGGGAWQFFDKLKTC